MPYYRKVIAGQPRTADAFVGLASAHAERGRLDEARQVLLEALAVDPASGQVHYNLAEVARVKGDVETARARIHGRPRRPRHAGARPGAAAGASVSRRKRDRDARGAAAGAAALRRSLAARARLVWLRAAGAPTAQAPASCSSRSTRCARTTSERTARKTGATPHLDALAARGTVFEEALASVPLTLPSHASILSGREPPHHGVHLNGRYDLPRGRADPGHAC